MGAMAVNNTGNLVRTLPMNYCDSVDDSARSLQPKWIAVETRKAQIRLFLWPRWRLARSQMSLFQKTRSCRSEVSKDDVVLRAMTTPDWLA